MKNKKKEVENNAEDVAMVFNVEFQNQLKEWDKVSVEKEDYESAVEARDSVKLLGEIITLQEEKVKNAVDFLDRDENITEMDFANQIKRIAKYCDIHPQDKRSCELIEKHLLQLTSDRD